jgi:hypothetical protein
MDLRADTRGGYGEVPTAARRPIDPLTTPLEDMTIADLTHCLKVLRLIYADAVRGRNREVAELRVKVAEREYEIAGRGLARARNERDALGLKEDVSWPTT